MKATEGQGEEEEEHLQAKMLHSDKPAPKREGLPMSFGSA